MSNILNLLNIKKSNLSNYKVRFMMRNKNNEDPLDDLEENFDYVESWVGWKWQYDVLNRESVIAFIRDYHINNETWIYVGTYKVSKKRNFYKKFKYQGYNLELDNNTKHLIGKLAIRFHIPNRQGTFNLENIYQDIEILSTDYHLYNEIRVNNINDWIKVLESEKKSKSNKILNFLKYLYIKKDHTSHI